MVAFAFFPDGSLNSSPPMKLRSKPLDFLPYSAIEYPLIGSPSLITYRSVGVNTTELSSTVTSMLAVAVCPFRSLTATVTVYFPSALHL